MDLHTISPQQIAAMSEDQKIALAKEAYAQFLEVMESVNEKQKAVLETTVEQMRHKRIDEVRNMIAHM